MRKLFIFLFTLACLTASAQDEMHRRFLERLVAGVEQGEMKGRPIENFLREEKIALLEGSFDDLRQRCRDTAALMEIFLEDGKRYAVRFSRENCPTVTIAYPVNHELIVGITMMEAEDRLPEAVLTTAMPPAGEANVLTEELLEQLGSSPVYRLKGPTFVLPELNADRYYVRLEDSTFRLLMSEGFPLESMANLVTSTEIESGLEVVITQVKYGHRTHTFTAPLRQWVTFCLAEGCTPYYGVISQEEDKVVCELVMHNESLGYAHVMKLMFNPGMLAPQSDAPRTVTARLNSYVPTSNVKALFDEKP